MGVQARGGTFVNFLLGIGRGRYDRGPKGESSIRHALIHRGRGGDGGYR
jgi:hypothetical protein